MSESERIKQLRALMPPLIDEAVQHWTPITGNAPHHDGDLGHNASVCYQDARYDGGDLEEVLISDKIRHVYLTPGEALSLCRWLEQEKSHLEELAKEQGND